MSLIRYFLLIAISNLILIFSHAQEIIVTDGDTIKIDGERIRFTGIDAPELNQKCSKNEMDIACGELSKEKVETLIFGQEVNCVSEGKDQYGRTLAECFVGTISISSYLVKEGYAFAYRKYSKKFIQDEEFAKMNNNGMWDTKFIFPWDFRRLK